jgi:Ion channel
MKLGDQVPDIARNVAATSAESRGWRRLGRSVVSADSYGLVLLLVVVTYVVSVSVIETKAVSIVLTVQLLTVWVTLRISRGRRVIRLLAAIGLCLAAAVDVVSLFAHRPGGQLGGIFIVCCLLYLIAPFSIVRHLMLRRGIDIETLLGAVAAYLLIGMFFAFAYKAAGEFASVPFFGSAGDGSLSQDLFFSFVTMTTVGYGNLVPAANPGQTLAVLEAVTGQLFLVVAVGKVISSMRPRNRGQPPSSVETSRNPGRFNKGQEPGSGPANA